MRYTGHSFGSFLWLVISSDNYQKTMDKIKLYTIIEQEESPFPNESKGNIIMSVRADTLEKAFRIMREILCHQEKEKE